MNGKTLLGWKFWDTTWEAYAKCQRIFTLKNGNNVCYNRCQEQSVESFMTPTCWKCHSSREAPRVAEGAVRHGSMWSRGSLIPYFPAVILSGGSQTFSPCWKMQCRLVVGAMDTPLLPTPSSLAQALPSLLPRRSWDQHVLGTYTPSCHRRKRRLTLIQLPWCSCGRTMRVPHSRSDVRVRGAEIPVQLRGEQDTALQSQELWQHSHLIPWEHMALTQNQVSLQSWWS